MDYIIPIHGIIGSPETKGDKKQYFSYSDFLLHLAKAKLADSITLDIASDGGYCDIADKMIKGLAETNKPISAYNSGNVASAASKLFTLALKEQRVFYPSKGVFLIHNPWNETQGDANDHLQVALSLQETETQYIDWYSRNTGTDSNIIAELMSENIPLTPSQIEGMGFATVINPTIQAFAKLNLNKNQMETKEVIEKLSVFETALNKIQALLTPKTKAIMIADVNGIEIEFPDLTDVAEIAVGSKTTAKDGEYVQVDGSTIIVTGGVVTDIKPAENNDMQALKTELEAIKAENESLKAEKTSAEAKVTDTVAQVATLKTELTSIKAMVTGFNPTANTPTPTPQVDKKKDFVKFINS